MNTIRPERKIEDYADILELPHPTSEKHPRMTMLARAAQFAPFAALTGYEALIAESARLVDHKIELSEEQWDELNARLNLLRVHLSGENTVRIVYFVKDPLKDGGCYETLQGIVRKIDPIQQTLVLQDRRVVPIGDLLTIDGLLFERIEGIWL